MGKRKRQGHTRRPKSADIELVDGQRIDVKRSKGGRPPKPPEEKQGQPVVAYLTESERDSLRRLAAEGAVTEGAYLRELLQRHLRRKGVRVE